MHLAGSGPACSTLAPAALQLVAHGATLDSAAAGAKMERDFCMCMNVAGDTMLAMHYHLQGIRLQRPVALDLLYSVSWSTLLLCKRRSL